MHGPQERVEILTRVVNLLELAYDDAKRLEVGHSIQPLVVSPTPAKDLLLVRTIGLAIDLTLSNRENGQFLPETMHPPGPSYDERKAKARTDAR